MPDPRPNIVLITSDDQRSTDLGVMDALQSRLVRLGTSFQFNYSSYPLCCPSRASILTGQYAHNHGVMGNEPPHGGFEKFNDSSTVATWLQAAGYNTLFLGKYLNRYGVTDPHYIPPGLDRLARLDRPVHLQLPRHQAERERHDRQPLR